MTVLRNYVQTISCHLLSVLIEGEITDLDGNNKVPNPSPPSQYTHTKLQYICWNSGHPDNENKSDGRTETEDSHISKSSQSSVR